MFAKFQAFLNSEAANLPLWIQIQNFKIFSGIRKIIKKNSFEMLLKKSAKTGVKNLIFWSSVAHWILISKHNRDCIVRCSWRHYGNAWKFRSVGRQVSGYEAQYEAGRMQKAACRYNFPTTLRATYVRRISSMEFSWNETAATCATRVHLASRIAFALDIEPRILCKCF